MLFLIKKSWGTDFSRAKKITSQTFMQNCQFFKFQMPKINEQRNPDESIQKIKTTQKSQEGS